MVGDAFAALFSAFSKAIAPFSMVRARFTLGRDAKLGGLLAVVLARVGINGLSLSSRSSSFQELPQRLACPHLLLLGQLP